MRFLVLGLSGSGKTMLIKNILQSRDTVDTIFVDYKQTQATYLTSAIDGFLSKTTYTLKTHKNVLVEANPIYGAELLQRIKESSIEGIFDGIYVIQSPSKDCFLRCFNRSKENKDTSYETMYSLGLQRNSLEDILVYRLGKYFKEIELDTSRYGLSDGQKITLFVK